MVDMWTNETVRAQIFDGKADLCVNGSCSVAFTIQFLIVKVLDSILLLLFKAGNNPGVRVTPILKLENLLIES